jgi:hypothetical protein
VIETSTIGPADARAAHAETVVPDASIATLREDPSP